MTKYVQNLTEITQKDIKIAGGKGASLGEMLHHNIPVPPGFVILSESFLQFLQETKLDTFIEKNLKNLDYNNEKELEQISKKIITNILKTKIPEKIEKEITKNFKLLNTKFVAVRSSATLEDSAKDSWAGELETYLNTQEKDLLTNVRKCWASLFSPRAIFYRFEKKLSTHQVAVAVVVQEMVQSEISGVAFTVNPITEDKNQMMIEAVFGLGEAIVGGLTTPDNYIVDKKKLTIQEKYISEQSIMIVKSGTKNIQTSVPKSSASQQKLPDKKILELSKICKTIEAFYKKPQDIEWAYSKGKFYITQSRPITTL